MKQLISFRAHATNLGVFRIAVFAAIAIESFLPENNARFFADVPEILRLTARACPPLDALPSSPFAATLAWYAMLFFCALAIAGVFARVSCAAATLLAFYVLGLPKLYGLANHHQHLIWFGMLLSVSPCGDALSMSPRRTRPGRPMEGPAYGIPLAAAWALIGIIYFFPGIWKASLQMSDWVSGEKISAILHNQWWMFGVRPPLGLPADLPPALLRFSGIYVLVFEIGFIAALPFRRIRPLAVAAGLGFHAVTYLVMGISFWPLVICYVVFVDWSAFFPATPPADRPPRPYPTGVIKGTAGLLIAANAFCGVFRIDAWPFAVYPTFLRPYEMTAATLRFAPYDADGEPVDADAALAAARRDFGRVRWTRLVEHIAVHDDAAQSAKMATALWRTVLRHDASLARVARLEISRTVESVRPDESPREEPELLFRGDPSS